MPDGSDLEEPELGVVKINTMKVSSQILETISSGIYKSEENAFKELISNAFDADATRVTIRAKPELSIISIKDDGIGMNYNEFVRSFSRISRSWKRDTSDFSPKGRRYIGKIGIGFIAVSQLCDKMTVISKKADEDSKIEAEIDFGKYRNPELKEKDFYDISQYQIKRLAAEDQEEHFTIVILEQLQESFRRRLEDKDTPDLTLRQYEGLPFERILDSIEYNVGRLRGEVGEYWRFMINLSNTIPAPYLKDGPIRFPLKSKPGQAIIDKIKEQAGSLDFTVDFDGVYLRRPIRLPELSDLPSPAGPQSIQDAVVVEGRDFDVFTFERSSDKPKTDDLSFMGYVYIQKRRIPLADYRGLVIRLRNVAIGTPDADFLEYPYSEKLFIPWAFGEVYVNNGLEQAMNVDRATFKSSDSQYHALKLYIHQVLHKEVFPRARERQYLKRESKAETEEADNREELVSFVSSRLSRKIKLSLAKGQGDELVKLDLATNQLIIDTANDLFAVRSRRDRWFAIKACAALVLAEHLAKGNTKKMLELFQEFLRVIL